ncbi:DUF4159 domain-containing protein [Granulibacter bethesdensis]|uniref:DUF4159 domain-containing protein n=1 Tax=Granulibacter bethesdensis TaxID=364410 RepID=UPI00090A0448|nr:DUF4159 domain-containing protein [Granulibacter bethesdensis]APH59987.1 putative membrane spanning protein [Granulibacter bethesdensis]
MMFLSPWLLLALGLLPILWWLLRATPPAPRQEKFPSLRLLRDLAMREETPARTPWWLLALRIAAAALVIIGLAGPVSTPLEELPGPAGSSRSPLLLVLDDGWASAPRWPGILRAAEQSLDRAAMDGRQAALLTTAPGGDGTQPTTSPVMDPALLRARIGALQPQPWATDHRAAAAMLNRLPANGWGVVAIPDGLAQPGDDVFAAALNHLGPVMKVETEGNAPLLLRPPVIQPDRLILRVSHTGRSAGTDHADVLAQTADGRSLSRTRIVLPATPGTAEAPLTLPPEIRNQLARLVLDGPQGAGGIVLLDEQSRRRPVGLVAADRTAADTPLLGPLYYLRRALEPYAEVREGDLKTLLSRDLSVLILADRPVENEEERAAILRFVNKGGELIRFAGPHLAAHPDDLLPVRLLDGDRQLGGAMSWGHPAHLAPFPPGPFAGLPPLGMASPDLRPGDTKPGDQKTEDKTEADIRVSRQVMAEPSTDLATHSWAVLEDGTPLVTERSQGAGRIVLFHVTANTDWSTLPLSGLFVEMLKRLVGLAAGVASIPPDTMLSPAETLDGFGQPGSPPQAATPLRAGDFASTPTSPHHPPGLYGPEQGRQALNIGTAAPALLPAAPIPGARNVTAALLGRQHAFGPGLIATALVLLALDMLLSLWLRGMLKRGRGNGGAALATPASKPAFFDRRRRMLSLLIGGAVTMAALRPRSAPAASGGIAGNPDSHYPSLAIHLAYVVTGNSEQDAISRMGLTGLADFVSGRTAATIAPPIGVVPGRDDLSFYPLLYWPLTSDQNPDALPETMLAALNDYMAHGGIILIDTRDAGAGAGMNGGHERLLQAIGRSLNVPPLTPLTPEHVLARSFYLLHDFPGRYAGGEVWVQRDEDRANDSVSPVIIGGNDWASAWAVDDQGGHPYATIPGGARQRLLAYRFGTNLVMYALTGNYKGDQVHVPSILDRLGQ